jgi:type I restriction enzyme, S subunit
MKTTYRLLKIGDLLKNKYIYEIQDGNHGELHPKTTDFVDKGIPFIMANNLLNHSIDLKDSFKITMDQSKKLRIGFSKNGDILLTHKGTIGITAIVENADPYIVLTPQVTYYRVNKDKLNNYYLLYCFDDIYFQKTIKSLAQQSTRPYIGITAQKKLFIKMRNINEQLKIVSILKTYDDHLKVNRKRIKLLEEAARLLYREWFVYFRFPGHEKVKIIKDGISKTPEGWSKEKVVNVVKRVAPGELYDQATAKPKGIVPILDQGQSGIIGYHNNEPSLIASLNNPVIVFANHTCNQRIIHFPFSAIQNIFPFLPSDENYRNIYWLHYATDNLVQLNAYKGHWPEFMAKNIVLPPADLCEKFGNIISMIHKQLFYLSIQNQKLAQARDLLLPRLMSGKIDVSEFDEDSIPVESEV